MPLSARRDFLAGLVGLAAAPWARAQAPRTIAYLGFEPQASSKARLEAFRRELAKLGHEVRYEVRSAEGRMERLPQLAEALAKAQPALILSESAITTLPLRQATSTIPIVMAACDDPLASRFVRTLEKPGGNATGVSLAVREEMPLPVEVLELMVPKGAKFAGLFNPSNSMYRKARAGLHYGAVKRGFEITYHDAIDARGIDAAFAALRQEKVAGLIVVYDPLFVAERARLVKLAAASKLPTVFPERSFVESGGRVSVGPSLARAFTLAAGQADRILKGANPAEVAVKPAGSYEVVASRQAPAAVAKRAGTVL